MKRLGRIFGGLIAIALTVASLQAVAAEAKQGGRNFNHMTTGFPLVGGHATASCETCHVGGVFKGTPRNCDECHAVGKRVLATPKHNAHIVTDGPCESCHFNTSTWLGARYNHGAAVPGQCKTSHAGRQATGKPATHGSGHKATASCDSCHRSSSWLPASWNHVGVAPGTCATCHNGTTATGKTGSHTTVAKATFACDACHSFVGWLPAQYKHTSAAPCASCHDGVTAIGKTGTHTTTAKATFACSDCHTTAGWLPAQYRHTSAAACSSCHNGSVAVGKPSGHPATADECNQCHTSTTAWLPALGAKPANHIPYNAGVQCSNCHVGTSVVSGPTLHTYLSTYACTTCHLKNNPYAGWGQDTKSIGHEGMSSGDDCSQSGCHRPLGSEGTSYINWK